MMNIYVNKAPENLYYITLFDALIFYLGLLRHNGRVFWKNLLNKKYSKGNIQPKRSFTFLSSDGYLQI